MKKILFLSVLLLNSQNFIAGPVLEHTVKRYQEDAELRETITKLRSKVYVVIARILHPFAQK